MGRGTDRPFEWIGAPWMDGRKLAAWLNEQNISGLRCIPRTVTPNASKYANEACHGVQFAVTEMSALEPLQVGLTLAIGLCKLYPEAWKAAAADTLLVNAKMRDAIVAGASLKELQEIYAADLAAFRLRRASVLIY